MAIFVTRTGGGKGKPGRVETSGTVRGAVLSSATQVATMAQWQE